MPFEVLVIPYTEDKQGHYLYATFLCNGDVYWAAITGGSENTETPVDTAVRETMEETGHHLQQSAFIKLDAMCMIPANWINDEWSKTNTLVPEYAFAVKFDTKEITLSSEHSEMKWLPYEQAKDKYRYDAHKIALWELNYRLTGEK